MGQIDVIDLHSPLAGLNRQYGFQQSPGPYTTPLCLNVRSQDVFLQRLRSGSRPGIVQVLPPKAFEIDDPPETVTTTIEFAAAIDTRIHSDQASSNFGTAANLTWGLLVGRVSRTLMHFDLTTIAGSTINSASLSVYGFTTGSQETASINRLTQTGWVEAQTTWNVYATATNWATAGGDFTATDKVTFTIPVAGVTQWNTVTGLATLVQDAITSRSNQLHIIIKSDNEATASRQFCNSSEAFTANPVLTVEYTA